MKHFIELTSLYDETFLLTVGTISQVVNSRMFPKRDLELYPELNERTEWTTIVQMCNPENIYVKEPYKVVKKKLEAALKPCPFSEGACHTKEDVRK